MTTVSCVLLDEMPEWARIEYLNRCPAHSWHVRNTNDPVTRGKLPNRAISTTQQLATGSAEGDYWLLDINYVEWTDDPLVISTETNRFQEYWPKGFSNHLRRVTSTEPRFAFYARISLVRAKPGFPLSNEPTEYLTFRFVPSSPFTMDELHEVSVGMTTYSLKNYGTSHNGGLFFWRLDEVAADLVNNKRSSVAPVSPPGLAEFSNYWEFWRTVRQSFKVSIYKLDTYSDIDPISSEYKYESFWSLDDVLYNAKESYNRDHAYVGQKPKRSYDYMGHLLLQQEKADTISALCAKSDASIVRSLSSGDVDIGMALAGLKQTENMLSTRLGQFSTFLRGVVTRRRDLIAKALETRHVPSKSGRKGRKQSNRIEDLFLEYQFGWKQLYNDINGAIDVLLENQFKVGKIIHVNGFNYTHDSMTRLRQFTRKRAKVINGDLDKGGNYTGESYIPGDSVWPQFAVQHNGNYRIHDSELRMLQQLGVSTPQVTLWDMVPYSFVIDWITNIDAVLKSVSYADGLTALPSTRTYYYYCPITVELWHHGTNETGTLENIWAPASCLITYRNVEDFSKISFTLDKATRTLEFPKSIYQGVTSLALLAQRVKR